MSLNRQNPEEQELETKLDELTEIEADLGQYELELRTLQIELNLLERRYLSIVGIRYAELDDLGAQIAKAIANSQPNNSVAQEYAAEAQERAFDSAQRTQNIHDSDKISAFNPLESLKKLYREVAKSIHPDLATDESERAKRQDLMARANQAYENGDELLLQAILDEWKCSPEAIVGDGVGAELVRVIRKISQTRNRLNLVQQEISIMKKSDLFALKLRVEEAESSGEDLISEMAAHLDLQIDDARKRLRDIMAQCPR
jgi:hypothetical protein